MVVRVFKPPPLLTATSKHGDAIIGMQRTNQNDIYTSFNKGVVVAVDMMIKSVALGMI